MKKAKILIVDDDINIIYYIKQSLEAANPNLHITGLCSGEECLEQVRRIKPDMIFMDIVMPGIDGRRTAGALKQYEDTKDIPIVFLTVRGLVDDRGLSLTPISKDFIQKPFFIEELHNIITTKIFKKKPKTAKKKAVKKKTVKKAVKGKQGKKAPVKKEAKKRAAGKKTVNGKKGKRPVKKAKSLS
ncbi:PleD family two-component system response regulator [Candidatus Altiarchaeota archaeon]